MMTHGGNIYDKKIEYDFSVNLNPLGMPNEVKQALIENVDSFSTYPDTECRQLRKILSDKLSINEDTLVFGNGAAELIYEVVIAIKPQNALLLSPAFSEYENALVSVGCNCEFFELSEKNDFRLNIKEFCQKISDNTDVVILCNPNNPNGLLMPQEDIAIIANYCANHNAYLVIDECFIELCHISRVHSLPHVITLRAFTKTYAMAGLRLGYCIINEPPVINTIKLSRQPWNISVPAQIAGIAALLSGDNYLNEARKLISSQRQYLSKELTKLGMKVYPSDANYLLFYSTDFQLFDKLLTKKILIRKCDNFRGLEQGFYRICVGTADNNKYLIKVLSTLLK